MGSEIGVKNPIIKKEKEQIKCLSFFSAFFNKNRNNTEKKRKAERLKMKNESEKHKAYSLPAIVSHSQIAHNTTPLV